jgi:hypothetical protein
LLKSIAKIRIQTSNLKLRLSLLLGWDGRLS